MHVIAMLKTFESTCTAQYPMVFSTLLLKVIFYNVKMSDYEKYKAKVLNFISKS